MGWVVVCVRDTHTNLVYVFRRAKKLRLENTQLFIFEQCFFREYKKSL